MVNHSSGRRRLLAGAALALVLAGCSSSPKEELSESADAKCGEVTSRFTGDLALGGSSGDQKVLEERRKLLDQLQDQVRGMAAPESGQAELDTWLNELGKLSAEMDDLRGQLQNARLGSDMVLAMQYSIVKESAKEAGASASRFGFTTCADTSRWAELPN
ncbi:hypothetical protein [Amycolatopsis nigrescens]|uniref:hypothetical protein n=1 Tax=Amycolatopsis nigrescens TaxID=381445 RepID=UPI000380C753|nr:hypothetical protein [Amycolatopsis nigrescens]